MTNKTPLNNARALMPVAASISGTGVAEATLAIPIVSRIIPVIFIRLDFFIEIVLGNGT